MEVSKEDYRKSVLEDAKKELSRLKAMKLLAEGDNDCEAVLKIDGIDHAFSTSQIFLPLIKAEIREIQKAIKGKPNKWE